MLIESLEKKTKLAMFTVLLAVSASAVTCAAGQRPTAAGVCAGREHPVYGRTQ